MSMSAFQRMWSCTCGNVRACHIGMLANNWGSIWGQRPDACLLLQYFC